MAEDVVENGPYDHGMARPLKAQRPAQALHFAELRKAAGYTQIELAQALGISQQNVARWETTGRPPSSDLLPKVAEVLGVTVEDVLNTGRSKPKRRGPVSRAEKLLEEVSALPKRHQEKIYDVLGALVEQYKRPS